MTEEIYNEGVGRLRELRQNRDALPLVPDEDTRRAARECEDRAIRVLLEVDEKVEDGAIEAARESLNSRWLFSMLLSRAAETLPSGQGDA